jgi:hypothetical protein
MSVIVEPRMGFNVRILIPAGFTDGYSDLSPSGLRASEKFAVLDVLPFQSHISLLGLVFFKFQFGVWIFLIVSN